MFGNGGSKGFVNTAIHGAALAAGVLLTLGLVKIITKATGVGTEFAYIGETGNTLNYEGPGRYGLS